MNDVAIEVSGLTKTYKLYSSNKRRIIEGLFPKAKPQYTEFNALKDVSFTIRRGEIVGIIGKNGSGKSTLLKIITNVLNPTSGKVFADGKISALLELGAGFNPEYTGMENIYLNGTLNGVTRDEMSTRVDEIATFADIGDFINQPVKNYSSGMFVRLAFAVAVYSNPDILIVDEALAVGDAAFQAKCMARMNQIMKSGATVLFVTHDMNTVKRLCQRCIYLERGQKIMEGPAEEIADVYLRRIRETMNEEHLKIASSNKKTSEDILDGKCTSMQAMELSGARLSQPQENAEFIERTKLFKEGTGDVEFIDLKLLDKDGKETYAYAYDQEMTIHMTLRVNQDATFGVGYHIRDDKNMELLGSSTSREKYGFIQGKKGEIYIVEMTTRLPIVEGNYNILLVASKPVIKNRTAIFFSLVENAAIFTVEENMEYKLWDKVYLKNEVSIKRYV